MSDGGIHYADIVRRCPCKVAAIWGVCTAAEVAIGALEARERLVDRGSIEDTDVLGSAVCSNVSTEAGNGRADGSYKQAESAQPW